MKKIYLLLVAFVLANFSNTLYAQNVSIPDPIFKAALVADLSINTNADAEIQLSEASAFLGTINVNGLGISDLTGIEAFTSLSQLNCSNNSLSSINISANTGLTMLDCRNNQLTSLDVSTNIFLYEFRCSVNQLTSLDVSNNTNLFLFACGDNQLTTLDVSANSVMEGFFCHNNLLTSIDVSSNPALVQFWCFGNQLTSIDVSANPNLFIFECRNNLLTSLNLSANTALDALACTNNLLTSLILPSGAALKYIYCDQNQLTSLDVSSNSGLLDLDCSTNQLANLDVSNNPSLVTLNCANNTLSSMNIASNPAINSLMCDTNQLTNLNVKNGNNINFIGFSASNNPNLFCIQVDSVAYAQANLAASIDNWSSFSTDCSNFLYVPDSILKAYLLAEPSINTNLDTEIQLTEAAAFTGTINVQGLGITDLRGIEAFTSVSQLNCSNNSLTSINISAITGLTMLDCRNNQLTGLNVSTNTALYEFRCSGNQLTSLDVSNNPNLFLFACGNNQLTTLDVSANTVMEGFFCHNNLLTSIDVSSNPALVQFWCFGNQLITIDVSANPNLLIFECNNNQLSNLNISANTALLELNCSNNPIGNIDLTSNTALTTLICDNNQLNTLDVSANTALVSLESTLNSFSSIDVSSNTALTSLYLFGNQLSTLDVSNNTALTYLNCALNKLTQLNAKNGNNLNFDAFTAIDNPNLYCIQVDDTAYSNANWTAGKAITTAFSEDCACTFPIPDANFKNALVADTTINTNQDTEIQCHEAEMFNGWVFVNNKSISNLTGIEKFIHMTRLDCIDNQLTSLDLSANKDLVTLVCYRNLLTSITFTGSSALRNIACGVNQLASLDLSLLPELRSLSCDANQLTTLDFSNNPNLTSIQCDHNFFTSLDLSNLTSLQEALVYSNPLLNNINLTNCTSLLKLAIDDCNMSSIDVSTLSSLRFLLASGNNLTSLDVSSNSDLRWLYMQNNNITSLDLSNNLLIDYLECEFNQLTYLNIQNNAELISVNCYNNQLSILDVSTNTKLTTLNCKNNALSYLNIQNGKNSRLTDFNATNNPLLNCIQVDTAAYMNANWSAGKDAGAVFSTTCGCVYKYWYLDTDNDGYGIQTLDSISCTQPVGYALNYPDCNDNDSLAHAAPGSTIAITPSVASFCNGTSNSFVSATADGQQLTYHWTVNGTGVTTSAIANETTSENLLLSFDTIITSFDVSVYSFNSCGISPVSSVYTYGVYPIPAAAGPITGVTSVSACANQLGITYSIPPIPDATHYYWTLPPLATIVGNADTNFITVNYSPYSTSGNVTVVGRNGAACDGIAASLAISYAPIPSSEICSATVDSASQQSIIFWQKPTESYVDAYVIYREINGTYTALDTIPDTAFSSYNDVSSRPDSIPENYKIATLDSCGNQTSISAPFKHQTIRLLGAVLLGGNAKLYWNDYQGVSDPTRYYTLLRDTLGNGAFTDTVLTNIPPSGSGSISFVDNTSANYPICRYVVELSYNSNCTPGFRTLTGLSTTRSNIKNKIAFFDSTMLGVGAKNYSELMEINAYPNPANDFINLSNLNQKNEYNVCLYNSLGACLQNTRIKEKNSYTLSTANYANGIYLLYVSSGKATKTIKIKIE